MQPNASQLYICPGALCDHRFCQEMLGCKFCLFTDHHSLKYLLTQTIQTPEQHKWITKLLGYEFKLHYESSRENKVADALSQKHHSIPLRLLLSSPPLPSNCIHVSLFLRHVMLVISSSYFMILVFR